MQASSDIKLLMINYLLDMIGILKNLFGHKKIILFMVILIITGIVFYFKLGSNGQSISQYKTITATSGDLSTVINASGSVLPENSATITFLTSGRITYIGFKEGDVIKKGQLIASLDTTQAHDAVSKAEANYNSAQSALNKVLDDIHLSQYGNGGFDNIGSVNETQTQKTLRQQAEMARDGAYQDLQSARKNLEWSTIIAPFDGIISDTTGMQVGQNTTAVNNASVTMFDPTGFKFVANVDETEYQKLILDETGQITLDAFPDKKFTGQITKIGVSAVKLATGGSVIPVDVSLSKDLTLKNALNGEVDFTVVAKQNVLSLPQSAIKKDSTQYVYLLVNGKPVKQTITTGQSLGSKVEITSGLKEGDLVVISAIK